MKMRKWLALFNMEIQLYDFMKMDRFHVTHLIRLFDHSILRKGMKRAGENY